MPKPRRVDRPKELSISIPASLYYRLTLALWSEAEGRVPHGGYRDFLVPLISRELEKGQREQGIVVRTEERLDTPLLEWADFLESEGYGKLAALMREFWG